VQRTLIKFELRPRWTDLHDLPDTCDVLHFDTLFKRRTVACFKFVLNILSGSMGFSSLLSMVHIYGIKLVMVIFFVFVSIARITLFMSQLIVRCGDLMSV
jgi:hypothetical protein